MLNTLNRELDPTKARLFGINFDDDPPDVTLTIARTLGIEFATLGKDDIEDLNLPAPDVMPTTYILTPANQIVAKLVGLQSREQMVAQLLRFGLITENPQGPVHMDNRR